MVQTATPCNVVSWPKAVFTLSSVTREPIYIGSSTLRQEQPAFKKYLKFNVLR